MQSVFSGERDLVNLGIEFFMQKIALNLYQGMSVLFSTFIIHELNMEGMHAIKHLLHQIETLQAEMKRLQGGLNEE